MRNKGVRGWGLGVWGLGFGVWGLGFGVYIAKVVECEGEICDDNGGVGGEGGEGGG